MKCLFIFIFLTHINISFTFDIKNLERKAYLGDLESRYQLGISFYRGRYHQKDFKLAFFWFELSAHQKHIASLYNLAIMYEAGDGVKKDKLKALLYFQLAQELGDFDAEYRYEELIEKLNKDEIKKVYQMKKKFKYLMCGFKTTKKTAKHQLQYVDTLKFKEIKECETRY